MKKLALLFLVAVTYACNSTQTSKTAAEKPEYFSLRPALEKTYGYTHAVKIGNEIKISGAVSMDNDGNLIAPGNMEQKMKNCYADLEKIL